MYHSDKLSVQFFVTNVVTILIPLWGMIGIWTDKFGYVSDLGRLSHILNKSSQIP